MFISDFVRTYCGSIDFYVSDVKPRRLDGIEFAPGAGHFYFYLAGRDAMLDGWYSMGSGLREYDAGAWRFPKPGLVDILSALILDARCGYTTFTEFCDELGRDEDSRKAYACWKRCVEVHDKLSALFGDAMDVLWECEGDE